MTTARIQNTSWKNVSSLISRDDSNTTAPLLYPFSILGDEDSVRAILDVLVSSSCGVLNLTVVPYDLTNTSQPPPESVIQYYRASSFALALDGYNNTAELPSNMPPDNNTAPPNIADTPLPANHTDTSFLSCINTTIGESLPILNSAAPPNVMQTQFAGIIGIIWLFLFALGVL